MWNSNKNGGMELKNQILEMDALSKLQKIWYSKDSKIKLKCKSIEMN